MLFWFLLAVLFALTTFDRWKEQLGCIFGFMILIGLITLLFSPLFWMLLASLITGH